MELGMDMSNHNEEMTCFIIDVDDDYAGEKVFVNDLYTMRTMIGTGCVRFDKRYIEGHIFRVIRAENADGKKISGLDSNGDVVFEGTIIILGDRVTDTGRPGIRTLSEEEKAILGRNLGLMTIDTGDGKKENTYCMCNMDKK